MMTPDADRIIGPVLKHDIKVTTCKMARQRFINGVVLAYADLRRSGLRRDHSPRRPPTSASTGG